MQIFSKWLWGNVNVPLFCIGLSFFFPSHCYNKYYHTSNRIIKYFISTGLKWTLFIFLCRFGSRTVELVIRNTSAPILPQQPWWPHCLLVNWHRPWWTICNTRPIFHLNHRSSQHLPIWMVKTWKCFNVFQTSCKQQFSSATDINHSEVGMEMMMNNSNYSIRESIYPVCFTSLIFR